MLGIGGYSFSIVINYCPPTNNLPKFDIIFVFIDEDEQDCIVYVNSQFKI
jgi:hypothetical protein